MLTDSDYEAGLINNQDGGGTAPKSVTPVQKEHWNSFLDYLQKEGFKGSPELDNRNTNLGKTLLAKFNKLNPGSQINYEDVPAIQTELQNYRQHIVDQWKKGTATGDDIKSEDEIMPGLSKVDGWLGSKTSSYKFPGASIVHTDGTRQNFGTNTDAYDKLMLQSKKAK